MNNLYHHPSCPFSRQIRVFLHEIGHNFSLIEEKYWENRTAFLKISNTRFLPVLYIKDQNFYMSGVYPIMEYLSEVETDFHFMPSNIIAKSKVREYMFWFNSKFFQEVSKILIDEKIIKLLTRRRMLNTEYLKVARVNLSRHMKFLSELLSKRPYLLEDVISCADIAAASHISIIDYLGEINWYQWPLIKDWYLLVKSRPAFQQLLKDRIVGLTPSPEYAKLDF